jgi:hypothetical protein
MELAVSVSAFIADLDASGPANNTCGRQQALARQPFGPFANRLWELALWGGSQYGAGYPMTEQGRRLRKVHIAGHASAIQTPPGPPPCTVDLLRR